MRRRRRRRMRAGLWCCRFCSTSVWESFVGDFPAIRACLKKLVLNGLALWGMTSWHSQKALYKHLAVERSRIVKHVMVSVVINCGIREGCTFIQDKDKATAEHYMYVELCCQDPLKILFNRRDSFSIFIWQSLLKHLLPSTAVNSLTEMNGHQICQTSTILMITSGGTTLQRYKTFQLKLKHTEELKRTWQLIWASCQRTQSKRRY